MLLNEVQVVEARRRVGAFVYCGLGDVGRDDGVDEVKEDMVVVPSMV